MQNAQLTDSLPLLATTVGHTSPPMFALIALVGLATGFVIDSPYILATGSNVLAEMGMTDMEQMGIRGMLALALCYVFKLLMSYHKDTLNRLDDEKKQLRLERDELIARLRQLNKERDDELKRFRDGHD